MIWLRLTSFALTRFRNITIIVLASYLADTNADIRFRHFAKSGDELTDVDPRLPPPYGRSIITLQTNMMMVVMMMMMIMMNRLESRRSESVSSC